MGERNVCAIVGWDAPAWARRIAMRVQEAFVDLDVRVQDTFTNLGGLAYTLIVVPARGEKIAAAWSVFQESLLAGRADLIVVDCDIGGLDTLCSAVQRLPRWPIAWLPEAGACKDAGSLDPLVRQLRRRLVVAPTRRAPLKR